MVISGFVNISVESSGVGQKWMKRFCVLKNGRLDCYKDPLDDAIEFSTTVAGASLDLSDKSAKRELAVRISRNGQEIFLEVSRCLVRSPRRDIQRKINSFPRHTKSWERLEI